MLGKAGGLTSILAIKSGGQVVVKLKNESSVLCEEWGIAGYVFEIGPNNTVASGGLRSGRAPDWKVNSAKEKNSCSTATYFQLHGT